MDDIVITEDDIKKIDSVKKYLQKYFQIKYLGSLKYLGVEVIRAKKGIFLFKGSIYSTCFRRLGC